MASSMLTRSLGESDLEGLPWFDRNWMFLAPFWGLICTARGWVVSGTTWKGGAVANHGVAAAEKQPQTWNARLLSVPFLAYFLTLSYSLHQFEEHGYDIFGSRYSFIDFFNAVMGEGGADLLLMTPRLITFINVFIVLFVFLWLFVVFLTLFLLS